MAVRITPAVLIQVPLVALVIAIDDLSFEANEGEIVLLLGPSGSGKTTLLSCLAGILTPTSGRITAGETGVTGLAGDAMDDYRRRTVGIVFQAFNLIPSLTARALAHDPWLLLADEPTADLDYINAEAIVRLLRDLRSEGRLIVISSHDDRIVPIADRVVQMAPDVHDEAGPPQLVSFAAGETIFEQGTRGRLIYVIEEGKVEIVRALADGGEEYLATVGPGEYFGELGPLLGFPRSATARAGSDVIVIAMGAPEFRRRMQGLGDNERAEETVRARKRPAR